MSEPVKSTMNCSHLCHRATKEGSVLVLALVTIVILSSILGIVLQTVSNRYCTTFQVAGWQEALFAAESGADIAMVEMRKSMQQDVPQIEQGLVQLIEKDFYRVDQKRSLRGHWPGGLNDFDAAAGKVGRPLYTCYPGAYHVAWRARPN